MLVAPAITAASTRGSFTGHCGSSSRFPGSVLCAVLPMRPPQGHQRNLRVEGPECCGAGDGDLAGEVDVGGHGGVGGAELVGGKRTSAKRRRTPGVFGRLNRSRLGAGVEPFALHMSLLAACDGE